LLICGCLATVAQTANITGKLTGEYPAVLKLSMVDTDLHFIDSVFVSSDGSFSFSQKLKTAGIFQLQGFENDHILVIVSPGDDIHIETSGKGMAVSPVIKGSNDTYLLYKYGNKLDSIGGKKEQAEKIVKTGAVTDEQKEIRRKAMSEFELLTRMQDSLVIDLFNQHPGSMSCLFFMNILAPATYPLLFARVDSALMANYPGNVYVEDLHQKLRPILFMSPGMLAPEIIQPDTSGKMHKLSDYRGKYVLIAFWASWCGPCRRDIPLLKEIYKQYKDKDFEIFAVSLDRSAPAWKAAITVNDLSWVNLGDMKYFDSKPAKDYGVSGIPYKMLIDPEGKIIAKNLRGLDIQAKLLEIFGE